MPDKRIAVVTGANQGVGLQVAKELAANGVKVWSGYGGKQVQGAPG
jgi:NAD(P)-dependent dehydrogenase (short-subunit alcohol dehydrogenase family)